MNPELKPESVHIRQARRLTFVDYHGPEPKQVIFGSRETGVQGMIKGVAIELEQNPELVREGRLTIEAESPDFAQAITTKVEEIKAAP